MALSTKWRTSRLLHGIEFSAKTWWISCRLVGNTGAAKQDGLPKDKNMTDRYRHRIRGTTYRVLFEAAKAQSSIVVLEDMTMVVYQSEADGQVWVRPAIEFFDGRFEEIKGD